MSETRCLLCLNDQITLKLIKPTKEKYWDCYYCGLIFLDEAFHLGPSLERAHYLTHNNDITDSRYQSFVSPIVDYVLNNVPLPSKGLDFGAGPGPVISSILVGRGYEMNIYDPYFWNDVWSLTKEYDFIVSCEVVEHFYSPADEFHKLRFLLRPDGHLTIMTDLYNDSIDFDEWYYHRDPTHVSFYRMRTFEWIKKHYRFKDLLRSDGRVVVLRS